MNDMSLIVRNIFDEEVYFREFVLEGFSNVANPIDAIVYINYQGHGILEVIYFAGEQFVHKSLLIYL